VGFISVLKKIGEVGITAAPIVASFAPAGSAASLIPRLIAAIGTVTAQTAVAVESMHAGSAGEEKMRAASAAAMALIPMLVSSIEAQLGRDMVDEALLARAVGKYLDASVDLMNAIKVPAGEPAD
jgi:hypothetical protein